MLIKKKSYFNIVHLHIYALGYVDLKSGVILGTPYLTHQVLICVSLEIKPGLPG